MTNADPTEPYRVEKASGVISRETMKACIHKVTVTLYTYSGAYAVDIDIPEELLPMRTEQFIEGYVVPAVDKLQRMVPSKVLKRRVRKAK